MVVAVVVGFRFVVVGVVVVAVGGGRFGRGGSLVFVGLGWVVELRCWDV